MSRIAIFIDGAYLDFLLRDQFGLTRIKYDALAAKMAHGIDIVRTYYYNCPPYQSSTPTQDERDRFAKAQRFHTYLERLPRYEVRLGRLAVRGLNREGEPIFEQKRVDLMLGVDLALLAGKGQITDAALLAGDSDLIPAVVAAKSQGVVVHLFHGPTYHKDLWDHADERTLITSQFIKEIKA
jgi:uncharacterized LabA/DUF88 family protein